MSEPTRSGDADAATAAKQGALMVSAPRFAKGEKMRDVYKNYWKECIAIAAEECDLTLTEEQLECLASSAESGHDHYGMAFYSPPDSDRIHDIEREWKAKLKAQQEEHERYVNNAETAIKQALRVHRDDSVTIGSHGEVLLHGGRTVQIQ